MDYSKFEPKFDFLFYLFIHYFFLLRFVFYRQGINIAVTEAQNQSEITNDKQQKITVQMPNVIGNSVAAGATVPPTSGQQTTTTAGTIPQDITTMSEHDLISYINPSCFE